MKRTSQRAQRVGEQMQRELAQLLREDVKDPRVGRVTITAVEVSPDGRFAYGSNRGDDSLAVFAVDPSTGRLTARGHAPVGGKYPRHFTIDPTGGFILAAHQNSGQVAVLRLDPASGMPALTGMTVKVDKPVCLLPVGQR